MLKKIEFKGLENSKIKLHIHKANSNAVLIMYPGAGGCIDGYNEKYKKIADLIQSKNIANVIRLDNEHCCTEGLPYCELMINKMAQVIEYVYEQAELIVEKKDVEIYLSGVSAGAGAIATVLKEFPEIKKVLLVSPADSVGLENIQWGLKNYSGEIYLTAGEDDEIGAANIAQTYYDNCEITLKKELKIIPKCNHQFTGKKNGMILSNAFLWAFSEKSNFPSHEGGLVLYE